MKTLIIHPVDTSTTFLTEIYKNIPNHTLITGGVTFKELNTLIQSHQRIIMCGHGSPSGLFSCCRFFDVYPYFIDNQLVSRLRNKWNLYIWCHADSLVQNHNLQGFYTGMFLSELSECTYYNIDCTEKDISESNDNFATIVGQHIDESPVVFYKNVLQEYGQLMNNPVVSFNNRRLFHNPCI